ncbi:carboxypeptidase regulatory-like domain-containing protein [bacterium]|nr:carboxypeptidase regulatory-like domain-containing protein [bacterium]
MKILNRIIITMSMMILLLGVSGQAFAKVAAYMEDLPISTPLQNENKVTASGSNDVTYIEDFANPLGEWLNDWFYLNTNAENCYTAAGSNCDPNYRGNQPDGLWISDDRGCGNIIVQSPVRINFFNNFGDNAISFSLDHFTGVSGVTFNIYDKDGVLDVSEPLPPDAWNWSHHDYPLSNGISAFEYSYTGDQVEGNTSIDNVTIVVGEGLGTINGYVTEASTGYALERAFVLAINLETTEREFAVTNNNGYYSMDLAPGIYFILCLKKNYNFAWAIAKIVANDVTQKDFVLEPKLE